MKKKKQNTTKNLLEPLIQSELKDIRSKISGYIRSAVLSLIGLESKYNSSVEIDHCNGRNSVLIDVFRKIASEEAEKIAKTYKPSKEDIAGFQEAFKKEYKNQFSYAARKYAEDKAKLDVSQYLGGLKTDIASMINEILGGDKEEE